MTNTQIPDPIKDLISQGKWLDVAKAITDAHVQQFSGTTILQLEDSVVRAEQAAKAEGR